MLRPSGLSPLTHLVGITVVPLESLAKHLVGPSEQTAEQMSEQVPQPGGERRHCQDWVLEQQTQRLGHLETGSGSQTETETGQRWRPKTRESQV